MKTPFTDRVLCVEEVFRAGTRGVFVTPKIPVAGYLGPTGNASVLLKKPDGSTTPAVAQISMPFVTPTPKELFYVCLLSGLQEEDVPIGTEVWIADET
jgi:hypothetical protein